MSNTTEICTELGIRLVNYEARMQEIWDETENDPAARVLKMKKFIYLACKEERNDLFSRLAEASGLHWEGEES